MRLIDADLLKQCYTGKNSLGTSDNDSKADYTSIRKLIDCQPTAYDVDKVIEQIKDEVRVIKNNMCVEQSEALQAKLVHRLQQTEKMLSIVKGAAVKE